MKCLNTLVLPYELHTMDHGEIDAITKKGLKILQERIKKAEIPETILDKNIKIATWNIRKLAGRRKEISLHYLAEILSNFNMIAITELTTNTDDLEEIMKILGPYWKVLYSDVNMDAKGNGERIAYLYDGRIIEFTGLAAEADPIRLEPENEDDEWVPALTWWRSPYLASFKAGRLEFVMLTAHVRWGEKHHTDEEKEEFRRQALDKLADWIAERRKKKHVKGKDMIVLGDFNIPSIDSPLFDAIIKNGLKTHEDILGDKGTNLARDKRYDQIFYHKKYVKKIEEAGAVDFYEGDYRALYPKEDFPSMTLEKFKYQISDHLPLWINMNLE